tara:strand:- start:3200 stop:3925 length:726 start_codon:yes stop_codon:yes gene_type:complete
MKQEERFFSQLGQDKLIDEKIFKGKKNGIFVDVGAHNGVTISNTCFFEKYRAWTGICIEPSVAANELVKTRPNSIPVIACVLDKANENKIVKLRQKNPAEISVTVLDEGEKYEHIDGKYMDKFKISKTLDTILSEHSTATQQIDYLSIDTEGSEHLVVKDFPFDKWNISVVTIANNLYLGTPEKKENRNKIKKLFQKNNFVLYKEFSLKELDKGNWGKKFKGEVLEDLYVNKDFVKKNKLK